jgi:Transcription factor regulating root and shoot growth via Pin3
LEKLSVKQADLKIMPVDNPITQLGQTDQLKETIYRSSSMKALEETSTVDMPMTSLDAIGPINGSQNNQKHLRIVTHKSADEVTEQIERGIYFTFLTLPSGKKGLKAVRFR